MAGHPEGHIESRAAAGDGGAAGGDDGVDGRDVEELELWRLKEKVRAYVGRAIVVLE